MFVRAQPGPRSKCPPAEAAARIRELLAMVRALGQAAAWGPGFNTTSAWPALILCCCAVCAINTGN